MLYPEKVVLWLAVIPAFLLAWFISLYAIDLPFADQYSVYHRMVEIEGEKDWISACWRQHNEHRSFFPFLIMLSLAKLTDWNVLYEIWMVYLLGVGCFVIIMSSAEPLPYPVRASFILISSLLFFSPAQWENWLWGFQIQMFLMLLAAVVAIYLVTRGTKGAWHILGSVLAAIVGSFSFANGLLIGPIVIASLRRFNQKRFLAIPASIGGFVFVVAIYFHGYIKPEHHPSLTAFVSHPGEYVEYVLMFLGHPMLGGRASIIGGFAGLVVFAWGFATKTMSIPQKAMGVIAILSAIVAGIGRVGFGSNQALESRYITVANLLWLADFGFLFSCVKHYYQTLALSGLLALFIVFGWMRGRSEGQSHYEKLSSARVAIIGTYPELSLETLVVIYPRPENAREMITYLREHRLSVFRKQL